MAYVINHGVQTQTQNVTPQFVPLGVNNNIFLVGTSNTGPVNTLTVIRNKSQATDVFGNESAGFLTPSETQNNSAFTIPNALRVIYDIANCNVIVVNVFNPLTHTTAISSEASSVTGSGTSNVILTQNIIYELTSITNPDDSITYIEGTDYTYSEKTGIVAIPGGALSLATAVSVSYTYVDNSKVKNSIIGGGTAGNYIGMTAVKDVLSKTGLYPNFICCPYYCQLQDKSIANAMSAFTTELNLETVISHVMTANQSSDVEIMLAERLNTVTGVFNISNTRVDFQYGDWEVISNYNLQPYIISGDVINIALAAFQETALSFGAGYSNVLHPALTTYTPIGVIADGSNPVVVNGQGANNYMNALNNAGINVLLNQPNYGLVVWGGGNSAFNQPGIAPFGFSNIQRSVDIIERLCATAVLPYVDFTDDFDVIFEGAKELIDSVLNQSYQLKIIDNTFTVTLDPILNTAATQAAGLMYIIIEMSMNVGIRDFRIGFNVTVGGTSTAA